MGLLDERRRYKAQSSRVYPRWLRVLAWLLAAALLCLLFYLVAGQKTQRLRNLREEVNQRRRSGLHRPAAPGRG